ncbi:hypothetical protein SGGMMB4_05914 [Sodalis glossinidius str. 'morsitans']|uniref:Multiple antibiotic resistance protein MarB n=1 Tax=Sodalis glossinidius (strain morsitans) TaxID=343509 RepID=A0A193QMK5_SODGM|nr:hypothetical protein SGGMMB4_05914 [Sodalis glossinidius str. 'morsitans']
MHEKIKLFIFTIALSLLSSGALAVGLPSPADAFPGTLAAASGHSGIALNSGEPGDKVNGNHSPSYPPTSLSGQRNMHSTAVIYN